MKTEEIIDRLRNPQKYNKPAVPANSATEKQATQTPGAATGPADNPKTRLIGAGIALGVVLLAALVFFVTLQGKNKAEDLAGALDREQMQGLVSNQEFNPYKEVNYVEIYEGQDRNVAVDDLGTTLPIVTRYNFQSIPPKNYGIIGMAPWALTENFAANIGDIDLLRYLLNRKEVAEAFIARSDVAPILQDPQLLGALAQDTETLKGFFEKPPFDQIFSNPEALHKLGGTRFVSHLLTSKAVKYYRDRPQEAVKLIEASPVLRALRQNPGVQRAVTENYYLKSIAGELLGTAAPAPAAKK